MKAINKRQDTILLNALQSINEIVENPHKKVAFGPDSGHESRLTMGQDQVAEYKALIHEKVDGGLIGDIKLDSKKYAHRLLKLKKKIGAH